MLKPVTIGLAGLMLVACATPIESNAPLTQARQAVESAEASGVASQSELSRARDYLDRTEAALEDNEAEAFQSNAALTEAFADLSVARGTLSSLEGDMADVSAQLESVSQEAGTCRVELEDAQSRLQECAARMNDEVADLAEALGAFSIEETSQGTRITLRNMKFGLESAEVDGDMREKLTALADYLTAHSNMSVRVHGHTDSTGPETYNQRLSQRRAESVAEILSEGGVSADRIETAGMGESEPAESNDTRAGRMANRRVEITLMAPSAEA